MAISRNIVVAVALCVATVWVCNAIETSLDRVNVEKYLQNRPLVEEHMRCLVYSGLFFTYKYTGITTSRCRVCTPDQERKLNRIAQHWQQNYPVAWRDLTVIISQG